MSQDQKDNFEQLLKRELAADHLDGTDCPDENLMAAYVENAQSSKERARVEKHLLQCARCQAELLFLVQSSEERYKPAVRTGSSDVISNTLSSWLQWIRPTPWKPVFAILIIAVVSSFLGYRLFQEQTPVSVINSERVAQSMQKEIPFSTADSPPTSTPPEATVLNDERQPQRGAEAGSSGVRLNSSTAPNGTEFKERRSSDATPIREPYAQEPPASPRDKARQEVPSRTTGLAEIASAAKGSTASKPAEIANDRKDGELREKTANGAAQESKAAAPPAVEELRRKADTSNKERDEDSTLLSQPKSGARNEVSRNEERQAGDLFAKKQKLDTGGAKSSGVAGGTPGTPARLEVAGKTFDLRDQVWTDKEITSEESDRAIPVSVPSPEFERLRPALKHFTAVVSRPEDVLIKLDHHTYRLRKSHTPPNP